MASRPSVKLFGTFQVSADQSLTFPTRKTACLFAYLAAHIGSQVSREKLRGTFWPDRSESQASGSLRRALSDIRKAFEMAGFSDPLRTAMLHVALDEGSVDVDASMFTALMESDPMAAAATYAGALCKDLEAPGSIFDAWLQVERERYHRLALELVEAMAAAASTSSEIKVTMELADRLLLDDALSEEAHRAKILCLQRDGRQNAAVRAFEALSRLLEKEIGAEPESQTRQLLLSPARPVFLEGSDAGDADAGKSLAETEIFYEKPCLAVLPFENMSTVEELGYFSDGITEDIISRLSRLRWLSVISKDSMFSYKAQSKNVQEVGYEVGARYVLGGSIRAQGSRLRVTARLSETSSALSIWSERFDQEIDDLFEIQDHITDAISTRLHTEVSEAEQDTSGRMSQGPQGDWQRYHKAMWHFHRFQKDSFDKASEILEELVRNSPNFARGHAALAFVQFTELSLKYDAASRAKLEQALEYAERAVSLDTNDDFCHFALSRVLTSLGQPARAMDAILAALDLNPNSATSLGALGYSCIWQAQGARAVEPLSKAIRLSPRDPLSWSFLMFRSIAFSQKCQFDEAIADAKSAIQKKPDEFWSYAALIWAAHEIGDEEIMNQACEKAKMLDRALALDEICSIMETADQEFVEKLTVALRASGLK